MTNIIDNEIKKIDEAFSGSSVMDTKELRMLYYGRLNLFVTFTDDGMLSMKPDSGYERPYGYVAHPVNDVIGKRVKTSEFYANVYRVNKNDNAREFIENIKQYDSSDLEKDKEQLYGLPYFEPETIEAAINGASLNSRLRSAFDELWEITETLAETKPSYKKQYWRRIFLDLGYNGIVDPAGTGKLIKKRSPVALVFNENIEELDIVPIQKHKSDPRQRTSRKVDRMVKRMAVKRNQVAKKRFTTRAEDEESGKLRYQMLGKFLEFI